MSGLDIQVDAASISWTPNEVTNDCRFITVACPVSALSAETYTLQYGAGSAELAVPYTGEPVCVDASQ